MKKFPAKTALVLASVFLRADACSNDLLDDPHFQLWDGDKLVAWQVDRGEIRRAPTWHRADFGLEFVGEDVQISQLLTGERSTCLQFDVLSDVDADAEVELLLDFLSDGVPEHRQPVAGQDFAPLRFRLRAPSFYDRARFIIRKVGPGRATLAQLRVRRSSEPCLGDPIELADRPLGANCERGSDCESGICSENVRHTSCGSCPASTECSSGEICGLIAEGAARHPRSACMPPGRNAIGLDCRTNAECQTGICCEGICSECCTGSAGCAEGSCRSNNGPYQCNPGDGLGEPGATCLSEDDCRSGACEGDSMLKRCLLDGRRCTSDSDCLAGCWEVGVEGGQCG